MQINKNQPDLAGKKHYHLNIKAPTPTNALAPERAAWRMTKCSLTYNLHMYVYVYVCGCAHM